MQLTGSKGVQDLLRLGGKGDLQGIVKGIKTWPYWQMVRLDGKDDIQGIL